MGDVPWRHAGRVRPSAESVNGSPSTSPAADSSVPGAGSIIVPRPTSHERIGGDLAISGLRSHIVTMDVRSKDRLASLYER